MENTPKSLRLQIVVAGRTNSGKSSLVNLLAGQAVAITSPIPGTTTDVVEKAMELRPLGPILFIDTAGLDDVSGLGELRTAKSRQALDRADVIALVTSAATWGKTEEQVISAAAERGVKVIPIINRIDENPPSPEFIADLTAKTGIPPVLTSAVGGAAERERVLPLFKEALLMAAPDDFVQPPPLVGDLIKKGDTVVLIVPVDIQAPKGRLILPQVQTLRDALDSDAVTVTVKESQYADALKLLKTPPALVVCDSQAVDLMVRETPPGVPCTTFSILFSRLKGDMALMAAGAAAIGKLTPGDRILIAEACTHHASEDDIGRVKIPRWLGEKIGGAVRAGVASGRDYPANLGEYKLIIHCGSCMLNRRETLRRIELARRLQVPITNYGMAISYSRGVIERVLSPFPEALAAFHAAQTHK